MLPTDSAALRSAPFVLEGWRVEPRLFRLHREGGEAAPASVQIEPKVMGVLACLAAQPGEPVSRDRLMEVVWPDVIVTDDALTRCVSSLRKQFGDTPRAGRVIETIPHVGYRLSAPITEPLVAPALPSPSASSVAVPVATEAVPVSPDRGRPWFTVPLIAAVVLALAVPAAAWLRRAPAPATFAARPLTALPGFETSAVLSPDGERVAFLQSGLIGMNLHVRGVDRVESLVLAGGRIQSPAWSPDGVHLAYVRGDADGCAIHVTPALGGPDVNLAPCPDRSFVTLDWSPDGRWIAASLRVGEGRTHHLHRIDAATGATRPLHDVPDADADDYAPRFSPEGSRIAFVRRTTEGGAALYIQPLEGGTARSITSAAGFVTGHAWTPDGAALYVTTHERDARALWRVPAEGGARERIAIGGEAANVHAAAGRVVVEQIAFDFDLVRASLTESDAVPTAFAVSTRSEYDPALAPGGTRLAFVSARAGSPALWLADPAGNHPVLAADLGERTYTPAWGPNGRLAVSVYDSGTHHLAVLDAPGSLAEGAVRFLDVPGQRPGHPTWSPDGAWIAFTTETDGQHDLWRVPSGGGAAQQLTTRGGFVATYTPDGARLLYTKRDTLGLWSTPAEGGAETLVSADPRFAAGSESWAIAPGGEHVYAVAPGDRPAVLYRVALGTGLAQPVRSLGEQSVFGGLAVDGDAVVFGRLSRLESDLFLLEAE